VFLVWIFLFNFPQKIVEIWTVEVRNVVRIFEWIFWENSIWVRLEEARVEIYVPILRCFNPGSLDPKYFEVVEG
jgi:hypothetical protein